MRIFIACALAFGVLAAVPTIAEPVPPAGGQNAAQGAVAHKSQDKKPAAQNTNDGPAAWKPDFDTRRTIGFVCFGLATIVIFVFAWKSEVLRDSEPVSFVPSLGPADTGADKRAGYRRSFSLSQSQMVWWFWIVISSYLYIAWTEWNFDGGLTQQALSLTGIGAATAVGAAIIDQQKKDMAGPLKDMSDAVSTIKNPPAGANVSDAYDKLNTAAARLRSVNFLADILSDVDGISLHRFQSFAWTVVLGVAFLIYVFANCGMPQLSPLELGILGISAGTYLGLKIPEKP